MQQLILHLIINAIEAMSGVTEGPRELLARARESLCGPAEDRLEDQGCQWNR
jgi:hypothetical protein